MDYKKLVDTALLAGKILLESSAETYRVEDVMNRILDISNLETTEAVALTTGLFITLDDPSINAITVMKRITVRGINLNNIDKVNAISRALTSNNCTLEEAYADLQNIDESQYNPLFKDIASSLISPFFALLLGGGLIEALIAWINGVIMVFSSKLEKKVNMGFFIQNLLYSALVAAWTTLLHKHVLTSINADVAITGSIMPLVPGTAITNAFRDTLRGDYMASGARAIEAVIVALSIAVGVALGLILTGGLSL